ncbi:MAG: AzlD domain-containing protein [Anaerolineaceae bacterium]|nr:AzlD domain-containing protein [Anaerolineaceae bacterium]
MDQTTVFLTLAGMALVTYLPRLLPAWFLRGRSFPPFLIAWLRYVPVAVLAALLLPSLLVAEGRLNLAWDNLYLWAAIPAVIVAWKSKNMFATVLTGMAFVALARLVFGL